MTSGGCSSCSDESEWECVAVTYNPDQFSYDHPGWIVRYEECLLGKKNIYNIK